MCTLEMSATCSSFVFNCKIVSSYINYPPLLYFLVFGKHVETDKNVKFRRCCTLQHTAVVARSAILPYLK